MFVERVRRESESSDVTGSVGWPAMAEGRGWLAG